MTMKLVRLATACVALLAAPHVARAQDSGLEIGSRPPHAMLQTLDGRTVDLATVAKGPAIVEFWATWCENCEHLLPALKSAYAKYGSRVAFVGVSVSANQSLNRVRLHTKKYGVPGLQLYDTKGEATGNWDVPATSHVVVIDRNGKVVYTGVGGTQDLEAAIRKVL